VVADSRDRPSAAAPSSLAASAAMLVGVSGSSSGAAAQTAVCSLAGRGLLTDGRTTLLVQISVHARSRGHG
jgi:hypothetical protein